MISGIAPSKAANKIGAVVAIRMAWIAFPLNVSAVIEVLLDSVRDMCVARHASCINIRAIPGFVDNMLFFRWILFGVG